MGDPTRGRYILEALNYEAHKLFKRTGTTADHRCRLFNRGRAHVWEAIHALNPDVPREAVPGLRQGFDIWEPLGLKRLPFKVYVDYDREAPSEGIELEAYIRSDI